MKRKRKRKRTWMFRSQDHPQAECRTAEKREWQFVITVPLEYGEELDVCLGINGLLALHTIINQCVDEIASI